MMLNINVSFNGPPNPILEEIKKRTAMVNRCFDCGLRVEQLGCALDILDAGALLVTWRMPDGRVFFSGKIGKAKQ